MSTDMSAEQDLGKPVLPPPHATEARSILSQAVETQLLPGEKFKGKQEGEVVDFRRIGEILGVLRRIEDHYEIDFYDGRGNLSKINIDPSSHEIAKATNKDWVAVDNDETMNYAERFDQLLNKLGFYGDLSKVRKVWASNAKKQTDIHRAGEDYGYMISKSGVLQNEEFFSSLGYWKMEVGERDRKEGFLFHTDGAYLWIDPGQVANRIFITPQQLGSINREELSLSYDLTLEGGESIFTFRGKNGVEVASFSGTDPIIDPVDSDKLYFINTGRIYSLDLSGVTNRTSKPMVEAQIKVENPQEIKFEPNGNFLIIRSTGDKLSIVDKESGDVVREFSDVKGPILVDNQGDIIYGDPQNQLREIQTNFQAIPPGGSESAREKREEQLKELQQRFSNLELGKVQKQRGDEITEQDVANTLRDSIAKQVSEPITNAQNPEAVEDILDRLQGFKADPTNQAYAEVIDEFVTQARDKLSSLRTADFDVQLGEYQKALDEVTSVGGTIGLDEQFAKLLQLRQKIDITDPVKRREIEQRLQTIQGQKDQLVGKYQGELVETINQTLPTIEQLIKETGSIQELGMFGTTLQAQQFEMMLNNIKDPEVRKQLRDRYVQTRNEQRGVLDERSRALDEEQRLRYAQVVEEAREDLSVLQEQILELSETRDVDRFDRNPLVTAFRAKIFALPPELREIEEKRLEIILGARKKDLEHRSELGAIGEGAELRFGNATFPIYKEPPKLWHPKFLPFKGGMYADLVFEDSQGRVFHPDPEHPTAVNPDLNDEKTKAMVDRYRKEADEYFRNIKRKVPDFDEHWRITDFHMGKLEEIAEALNLQLVNHRGILILQGEAGTGKNVLVDMLANLSNRAVIPVLCNENSVKEDLTYEFYYDPEKGTYKLPSKLIEGIQTPGTVILFDEINALKPGIAKMLNSLFDYRRRIYLPEGGKERDIITDPSVLFIGTMNPQNYGGVTRLSPEVKSRARVVDLNYPPFEERRGGRIYYRSDEAEMLAAYMDEVGDLKQKEFKQAWDYVVNNDTTNGADAFLTDSMKTDISRIYDVIRVANRLREMYEAYQIGDSNEPMDFPTSLREVTDIVMEMNHRQGVKPIVKRVIIPKIDDRAQKRMVETAIDAVLPGT